MFVGRCSCIVYLTRIWILRTFMPYYRTMRYLQGQDFDIVPTQWYVNHPAHEGVLGASGCSITDVPRPVISPSRIYIYATIRVSRHWDVVPAQKDVEWSSGHSQLRASTYATQTAKLRDRDRNAELELLVPVHRHYTLPVYTLLSARILL